MFEIELFVCIKMDLASNNLQRLICDKTQTNKEKKIIPQFLFWFPFGLIDIELKYFGSFGEIFGMPSLLFWTSIHIQFYYM